MAAKSKKKRSTKSKKQSVAKKSAAKQQSFVVDEILIWLTLAVSILILLSNFGMGGSIGNTVADFLQDIFGILAYVVPFVLFGIVAFLVSNKDNSKAYGRAVISICLLVLICTFFELVNKSGGLLGNTMTKFLVPAIGVAGTYVVDVILMIICSVILTGKSALKGVKTQSDRAYVRAKDDMERRRQFMEERRRERANQREQKRSDHRVEGVSFDTTIKGKAPAFKEMEAPTEKKEKKKRVRNPVSEHSIPEFLIPKTQASVPVDAIPEEIPAVQADFPITGAVQREELPFEETPKASKKKAKLSGEEMAKETADVAAIVADGEEKEIKEYQFPPLFLLKKGDRNSGESDTHLRETAIKLQQTLQNFGVNVTVTNVSCGPAVTRYELQPEMGVKVSKIVGLADDIKLNLAAADIRIEAPIPGKAAVGIEVPNKENSVVMLRDLLETAEFQNSKSKLSFAAGKDIGGKAIVTDIAKMPHLLVAGATGSGKSVCINTLIMSILYKAKPDEVKLIMIDPKVVELSVYNGIPHLMIPVVTDPKKAAGALNWAVAEMTRRYQAFAEHNVRDMKGFNEKIKNEPEIDGVKLKPMAQIVIIVDELADLMMVASGEVEEAICRLAQLARAAGIHLVVATQRPSVNVITGLIKANMPSRIAFAVSSGVDSRTIIDMNGAEKLLGKGDMLFYPAGYPKPARVQGSFVTDAEVQKVVEYLCKSNGSTEYDEEIVNHVNTTEIGSMTSVSSGDDSEYDAYFIDAGRLIIEKEKASIGMLQRAFKIGFNRAARIMDQLCEAGVVGGEEGTKPRKVLMSKEEFEQLAEQM